MITYSGKSSNDLTGLTRGTNGTSATTHANGATVTNASDYSGWGVAVPANQTTLEPGLWSFTNFGEVLVATIANGETCTEVYGTSASKLPSWPSNATAYQNHLLVTAGGPQKNFTIT